jgi:sugar-phosphatase
VKAERSYAAFLFDMDGTLINSIPSAIRAWTAWAQRHGVDVPTLMNAMHGVRAIETIRHFAPEGVDIEAEAEALTQAEMDDVEGIVAIPGVADFLATLPADRWAIVTSAPRLLAERRLAAAGLSLPAVVVTADDVERGKPAPDCFLAAAAKLGVPADECLVWEDAPAGIAAGEAAGADVIVVTATHHETMTTSHRTVADYDGLVVSAGKDGRMRVAF